MGGVGFTEMLLLAVIALIVVGPQRLPGIARMAGKLTRQARNAWQGLQSELQAELDADHNRKIMESSQSRTDSPASSGQPSGESASAQTASDQRDESAYRN